MPTQSNARIAALNERISKAQGMADLVLPGANTRGDKLKVIVHEFQEGKKELTLVVKGGDGTVRPSLEGRNSAPIIKLITPISTIQAAYGVSPKLFGKYFDPNSSQKPNAAFYMGPAGDVDAWNEEMSAIDSQLVEAFALALKKDGTCIPKDTATNAAIAKKAKLSKKDFVDWVEDELAGHGSPHCAHLSKRMSDRSNKTAPYKFSKNLFPSTDTMMDTPYDTLIGPKERLDAVRRQVGGPCSYRPPAIYVEGKLVPPEEYEEVASKLQNATAYCELGAKLFTNRPNKVVSLKLFVLKVVVSALGESSSRNDTVVDVFDTAALSSVAGGVDEADILDVVASTARDADFEGGGGAAKRARTD
jgi:hypothetical protein